MAQSVNLFLDLETSGLKPETGAVILAIGAVAELKGKANAGKLTEFYTLVRPTPSEWRNASPEALRVNGLTWEVLEAEGKPLEEAKFEFVRWAYGNKIVASSHLFVGQNPEFDLRFLRYYVGAELRFIGFPLDEWVDNRDLYSILVTRKLMPWLNKDRGGRTSENISKALGTEPERFPHNALEGARAVMRNYNRMLELGARS